MALPVPSVPEVSATVDGDPLTGNDNVRYNRQALSVYRNRNPIRHMRLRSSTSHLVSLWRLLPDNACSPG